MAVLTVVDFPAEPAAFDIAAELEAAAAGGDTFENNGRTGLYVRNSSGSPKTLTIDAPRACNHGFTHDAVIVVADGFEGFVATELPANRFNSGSGIVSLTYSAAGLDVAAIRLP